MQKEKIILTLTAEPHKLTISHHKDFKIAIAATNQDNKIIDPELHLAKLFVNGVESPAWNLAIGNGFRETNWYELPPGETISMTWSSMGKSLFPTPGDYVLVLRLKDTQAVPVKIKVLAE